MRRPLSKSLLFLILILLAVTLVAGMTATAAGRDPCDGPGAARNPSCDGDGQTGQGGQGNTGGPPPGDPPCGQGSAGENNPNCEGQPPPSDTCTDGLDNDGDGQPDGADAECGAGGDGVEDGNPPQCSNGVDDDGDGQTDFPNDAGCDSAGDNTEAGETGGVVLEHRCAAGDGLDLGGGGTVAEQAFHGLFEDTPAEGQLVSEPTAEGAISKEFYDRSQGQPVEPLGEEIGCPASVVHEGEL